MLSDIKKGKYPLDDTYYLVKNKHSDYVIIEVKIPDGVAAVNLKLVNAV